MGNDRIGFKWNINWKVRKIMKQMRIYCEWMNEWYLFIKFNWKKPSISDEKPSISDEKPTIMIEYQHKTKLKHIGFGAELDEEETTELIDKLNDFIASKNMNNDV